MRYTLVVLWLAALTLAGAGSVRAATPFTARDNEASVFQTSWSPDGRWIAYADTGYCCRLAVISPDGSTERTIVPLLDEKAIWSPDGRLLAWANASLMRVAHLDSRSTTEWAAAPRRIAWAPDSQRLAYRDVTRGSVLVVSAWNGDGRVEIASPVFEPEWSPDGEELAFFTGDAIQGIRSDGSGRRTITNAHGGGPPRWSPTGDRIAFTSSLPNDDRLYVVGRDGEDLRAVADVGTTSAWSPDGRWLSTAGELLEVDGPRRVHLGLWGSMSWSPSSNEVVYDRGGVIFLTSTLGFERELTVGFGADWAPDGRRISFLRAPYGGSVPFEHCSARVFVINADGTDERPLSSCRLIGFRTNDVIVGTIGRDEAFGLQGADVIEGGPGRDSVFGGAGADRLLGGAGADVLSGGAGNDRLGARDRERDEVRCGRGRDIAYADAADRVARDCERVRRR